jgi:membrane fusion protein, multidrug efflux system
MDSHCDDGSGLALLGLAPSARRGATRKKRYRLRLGFILSVAALFLILAFASGFKFDVFPGVFQAIGSHALPPTQSAVSSRDPPPVRVQASKVRTESVPIYLSGIGTVQAYNTVNVTTRVDGQITQILFHEGQDVKAGDALAIIDPRPYAAQLEQAKATLLKDQALLDQAISDLHRYEILEKSTSIAQQQAEDQRFLVMQYHAQVKLDEANVDYANTQLEYTTIRAPIDGRTGIRQVDQGNIVYAALNTTIVVLTQLRPISVIFTFPARDVATAKLVPGQTNIPVTAYADDDNTALDRGTVDLVDNEVDPTTGNIKLRASFPNEALHLWPGDFVNGRVIVQVRRNGLTIPPTALRHGPRGDFVWIVRDDKTVWAQNVRVRQSADGRVLLDRTALKPDQNVVTEGHFLLQNGTRVEVFEPGPPPARLSRKAAPRPEADAQ